MDPIILTEPSYEPVSVIDVKAHCRIDVYEDGQEAMLNLYISRARDYVEWVTGRTIFRRKMQANFGCWPRSGVFALPWATPLLSVESLKYFDSAGVERTVSSSDYEVSAGSIKEWGRIAFKSGVSLPGDILARLDPIRVTYWAGLNTEASPAAEAEASVKGAILELVARFVDLPEAELISDRASVKAVEFQYGFRAIAERLKADRAYEF